MGTLEPEFPRPSVGDELIVYQGKSRYREEEIIKVRVRKMARFRVELEGPDGEDLPWMYAEFDIRNRGVWGSTRNDRPTSNEGYRLHTEATLAWHHRKRAADAYLRESRVHTFEFRGTLAGKVRQDPLGFANALRRYEGLEEL